LIAIEEIRAARERLAGRIVRTPLVRLELPDQPGAVYLKLENLQPIGSFKLRGAGNAIARLNPRELREGVYTASAGNMAQGVAWSARALGVDCEVVMPDSAPRTKVEAVERLGGRITKVPFAEWWQTLADFGRAGMKGRFIHPVADRDVMAGNGTIGLEIVEDLPDVDTVLVPFGGGGLTSGIATALRAVSPQVRVFGCEVATSTPLTAALAANGPVTVERAPSFVDGIGGRGVLPEMWPIVRELVAGALVASVDEAQRKALLSTAVAEASLVGRLLGAHLQVGIDVRLEPSA